MTSITFYRTNGEIMRDLGARLRNYRLQQNLPVAEVARQAGLSAPTVLNAERGRNPRLDSMVRILRVLGRLDALDAFLPAPPVSPLQLARLRGRPRRRARRAKGGA